jgi:WD40 repeat protein
MIWDRRLASKPLHSCRGHTETVSGCCFVENAGGQFVVSVSADGSMRIWGTVDGKCENISTLPEGKRTMCCSSSLRTTSNANQRTAQMASGCVDGSLYQWDVECASSGVTTAVRVHPRSTDVAVRSEQSKAVKGHDVATSYSSTAAAAAIGTLQ